jgi:hypothetical protein
LIGGNGRVFSGQLVDDRPFGGDGLGAVTAKTMNHSVISADRNTHFKMTTVALG